MNDCLCRLCFVSYLVQTAGILICLTILVAKVFEIVLTEDKSKQFAKSAKMVLLDSLINSLSSKFGIGKLSRLF